MKKCEWKASVTPGFFETACGQIMEVGFRSAEDDMLPDYMLAKEINFCSNCGKKIQFIGNTKKIISKKQETEK